MCVKFGINWKFGNNDWKFTPFLMISNVEGESASVEEKADDDWLIDSSVIFKAL